MTALENTDHEDMKVRGGAGGNSCQRIFQELFRTMDADGSGTINIKELIDFLTAVGGDVDKDEVTDYINELDNLVNFRSGTFSSVWMTVATG